MLYVMMSLLAAVAVGLDQWTKYLTVQNVPTGGHVSAIDGLFHITLTHNTGAAWSMLEGQRWFFLIIVVVFIVGLIVAIWKKWLDDPFELMCMAAITGGAIGNAIDRAVSGAVVDMIALDFMNFPIFNVADCFITVGAIAMIVHVLLFSKKPAKPKETPTE